MNITSTKFKWILGSPIRNTLQERINTLQNLINIIARANNEDIKDVEAKLRKIAEIGNVAKIQIGDHKSCSITPPRIDLLKLIADHATKFGFVRLKYDPYVSEFNLFHLKRGIKITNNSDAIKISARKNRTYRYHSSYKTDNIHNPDGSLNAEIRFAIEELAGDQIQRNDLVQNMMAIEVRELLFDTHVRCSLNKARRDDEPAKLTFKGTTRCLLDKTIEFVLTDGTHHGTFNIFISVTDGIIVHSQLSQTYKAEITPESPYFTPENIAAWIKRCAEADLHRAILLSELKTTTKTLRSELKQFVIE